MFDTIYEKPGNAYSEWITPRLRGFQLGCCSCGSVHDMEFRVLKDGKVLTGVDVEFRVKGNFESTCQLRRQLH